MRAYTPIPELTDKDKARFWAKVNFRGAVPKHCPEIGNCWEWTGSKSTNGYGNFSIGQKSFLAHRIGLHMIDGSIPYGMQACHRCDNIKCIRGEHLFPGTHADNMKDCASKGRNVAQASPDKLQRGARHWARLFPEQVRKGFKVPFDHTARGEMAGPSKLKESDVRSIRDSFHFGGITKKRLAEIYGVSNTNIGWIIARKTWAHIE